MSARGLLAVTGLIAALGLTAGARQEVSEADYEASMKELRFLVSDAQQHIDSSYWPELGEDVDKFIAQFEKVEAFWTARGTARAADLTQQALAAVMKLNGASRDQNPGAGRDAVKELQSVCQACHTDFREETADGFRIKPGV